MKSSQTYADELQRANGKWEQTYKVMLRCAAKLNKLDRNIRRLSKAVKKAKKFERDAANGQSFAAKPIDGK